MLYNGKYYFMVNVLGRNGYSFMVASNTELNDNQVIELSLDFGLFDYDVDAEYASIDRLIDERDITHFEDCNCLHNI